MSTETQKLRGRPVTHEEARAATQRLIDAFWFLNRQPPHYTDSIPRGSSIPARATDDDVTVMDYIQEQQMADRVGTQPAGFGIIHVVQQEDGKLLTFLARPDSSWGPPHFGLAILHFGLAICDIVRHVAKAFNVHEDAVWEWVDKEREKPTTELSRINPS